MCQRVFLSFGNEGYRNSLARLCREAEATGLFSQVIATSERDLPSSLRDYCDAHPCGYGFWSWKPVVVKQILDTLRSGDILFFADAGCSVLPHPEWRLWFRLLKKKGRWGIFFPGNSHNGKWCDPEIFSRFTPQRKLWKRANQVQGGIFMIKKTPESVALIDRWATLAVTAPELFEGPSDEEEYRKYKVRGHRNDQSVLNACLASMPGSAWRGLILLKQRFQKNHFFGQALLASRISDRDVRGALPDGKTAPHKYFPLVSPFILFGQRLSTLTSRIFFRLSR